MALRSEVADVREGEKTQPAVGEGPFEKRSFVNPSKVYEERGEKEGEEEGGRRKEGKKERRKEKEREGERERERERGKERGEERGEKREGGERTV